MNRDQKSLAEILAECTDAMAHGVTLEECLAKYPGYADELAPLLWMAHELQGIPLPAVQPGQIGRIEQQVFQRLRSSTASPILQTAQNALSWILVTAATILIVAGGTFAIMSNDDGGTPGSSGDDVSIVEITEDPTRQTRVAADMSATSTSTATETEPPTAAIASATVTYTPVPTTETRVPASATPQPPSPTPTASDTPTPDPEEEVVPIFVDLTGTVQTIDATGGTLTIDGITAYVDAEQIRGIETGKTITISGELSDSGDIAVDTLQPTGPEVMVPAEVDCHPVLHIIANAYGTDCDVLEALHAEGLGVGEISRAYALADQANVEVDQIIEERQEGRSWGEILSQLDDLSPGSLAAGIVIGNGKGTSIRPTDPSSIVVEPRGNSGNAPGQSDEAPGNSGNAPGQSGAEPGNRRNAPGQSDEAPGNSGNTPGHSDEGPLGQSNNNPPGLEGKDPPGRNPH
ncbi:MAG: hypothetical protein GYB66_00830 [Chloroflexi bacterium]|nr:hypothetical protein [Chloroflexota bacterium]